MTVYADSESPQPKGVRALGLAGASLICLLMGGAATITLLGNSTHNVAVRICRP
jgi:hypothetical protein